MSNLFCRVIQTEDHVYKNIIDNLLKPGYECWTETAVTSKNKQLLTKQYCKKKRDCNPKLLYLWSHDHLKLFSSHCAENLTSGFSLV